MYVRDGLALKVCHTVPADIECLVVEVSLLRRKKLTVVACCRPPRQRMNDFLDSLETVLSAVYCGDLCLTGDFNAKHSEWYSLQSTD